MELSAPQPLDTKHVLDLFECGQPALDDWLKRRALANHLSGGSRVFVVADDLLRVVGYYALAAGAIGHELATGQVRRNMPDPIPVMVLGRLAVDSRAQGLRLGAALLQDAVSRVQRVAGEVAARALIVHAIDDNARQFYEHYGFRVSPMQPLTLMLRL